MNASVKRPATTTAPATHTTINALAITAPTPRRSGGTRRPMAAAARHRPIAMRMATGGIAERKNRVFWYGDPARKTITITGQPTRRMAATSPARRTTHAPPQIASSPSGPNQYGATTWPA